MPGGNGRDVRRRGARVNGATVARARLRGARRVTKAVDGRGRARASEERRFEERFDGAHRGASRARDVVVGAVADPRGTGVEDDANVGTPAKAAPANGRGRGARGRGARGRGGSRVPSPLRNFASLSPEDVRAAAAIVDAFDAALRRGDLEGCVAAIGADDESSGASDEDDDEGRWVGATRGGDDDRRGRPERPEAPREEGRESSQPPGADARGRAQAQPRAQAVPGRVQGRAQARPRPPLRPIAAAQPAALLERAGRLRAGQRSRRSRRRVRPVLPPRPRPRRLRLQRPHLRRGQVRGFAKRRGGAATRGDRGRVRPGGDERVRRRLRPDGSVR